MCADPLHRLEILVLLSTKLRTKNDNIITWTAAAPVSRVLFIKLSGSPKVLLVTGSESILWQALSDMCTLFSFKKRTFEIVLLLYTRAPESWRSVNNCMG